MSASTPNISTHHPRAASLSIARSPSILASTTITGAPAQTPPGEHEHTHEHGPAPSYPLFLPASQAPAAHTLTRTTSHPAHTRRTKSTLSDIPSDEDRPAIPLKRTVTFDAHEHIRQYDDDGVEDGLDDLESGPSDTHTHAHGHMGEDHVEGGARRGGAYTGGFQKPDSKELMGIWLSIVGVTVLSLAAGLATVYDWVL